MAKNYQIKGSLGVGKGADIEYIGEDTDVTHISKDDAKKYGINAKEFERLVNAGVLVDGTDEPAPAKKSEPQPLSAAKYMAFKKAVTELDEAGVSENFSNDGKPELKALKEKGVVMSAAERDEAFEIYMAE